MIYYYIGYIMFGSVQSWLKEHFECLTRLIFAQNRFRTLYLFRLLLRYIPIYIHGQ